MVSLLNFTVILPEPMARPKFVLNMFKSENKERNVRMSHIHDRPDRRCREAIEPRGHGQRVGAHVAEHEPVAHGQRWEASTRQHAVHTVTRRTPY